jgi:hypothetical protein
MKPYKNKSKHNKKQKVHESATGLDIVHTQNKRSPTTFLPEVTISPMFQCKKRFIAQNPAFGNITIADFLNQFLFAVSTTSTYCYVKAVRLVKICALCPITTQGTSIVMSMQPAAIDSSDNCFNAVPEKYLDTSSSIDYPAYISLKPSITTPLGSWHMSNTTSSALLVVNFPVGSVVDMTFEYIMNDNFAPSTYLVGSTGLTLGQMYGRTILSALVPQVFAAF